MAVLVPKKEVERMRNFSNSLAPSNPSIRVALVYDVFITSATQIDGFDSTGVAHLFPSKAKQVTMYQWILIIFLAVPPDSTIVLIQNSIQQMTDKLAVYLKYQGRKRGTGRWFLEVMDLETMDRTREKAMARRIEKAAIIHWS
ncbi:hypothetical protein DFH08DRAFT_819247 [Mycena albidolilacea]|uniref:Uncharacterized protein n=1 Tax=Mycena albidolilacea TaxID=1033008 RepID=A0AAD7EF72_9AGAR|nr:hypothetical protein DFH08DRAFT_819247 [Mycena albidolilacea]